MSSLEQLKENLKKKYPFSAGIARSFLRTCRKHRSRKSVFLRIYRKNCFGGRESVSGAGSDLVQTSVIRNEIPALIKEIGAKLFFDAPCGDYYWMKETRLGVEKYVGGDIVPGLIDQNRKEYGGKSREFMVLDIVKDRLPQVDLIFCRDCLVHLSYKDSISAVRNFKKSKSTYLLTTTFTGLKSNRDIITGNWRTLNLERPPFNFPEPLKLINEKCTLDGGIYSDNKCLA